MHYGWTRGSRHENDRRTFHWIRTSIPLLSKRVAFGTVPTFLITTYLWVFAAGRRSLNAQIIDVSSQMAAEVGYRVIQRSSGWVAEKGPERSTPTGTKAATSRDPEG